MELTLCNFRYLNNINDFQTMENHNINNKFQNYNITLLTMNTKCFKLVFINIYSTTEKKEENEKDEFYMILDNSLNIH